MDNISESRYPERLLTDLSFVAFLRLFDQFSAFLMGGNIRDYDITPH
jgi:hypothetical protein